MPQSTDPKAETDVPVTRADLLYILDTHGLRFAGRVGRGKEAKELQWLYNDWVARQGIRRDLSYVMPLRAVHELLCLSRGGRINERGVHAWRVLVDAVNDPDNGIRITERRYASRSLAV